MATPVNMTHACAITGGFLKEPYVWYIQATTVVDGIQFVLINRGQWQVRQFLGENFGMLDALVLARNAACEKDMTTVHLEDEDPMAAADEQLQRRPLKQRRTLFADVKSDVITVTVQTDDNTHHHVRVLPHWHSAARLTMELTQANVELLLRTPASAVPHGQFRPTITLPNIGWNKSRNALFCWWYDGSRWRNKSMIVKHHDAAQLQSVAHAVERQLSEWREAHHFTTNYDESYEHADAEEDAQNAAHGV